MLLDRKFLVLRLERPDLRRLIAFRRHANIKAVAFGKEISGSNANSGRDISDQLVVVRVLFLNHADDPLSADNIDTLPGAVKENVVAFTRGPQSCDFIPRLRVQDHQHVGLPCDRKEAMVFFVQSHRIISAQPFQRPFGYSSGLAIDRFNHVTCIRDVNEYVPSRCFDLKRLRVPFCLIHLPYTLVRGRINHGDSAVFLPEAYKNHFGSGIITHVVRIARKINGLLKSVRGSVIDSHLAIFRVCDVQLVKAGYVKRSLRLAQSFDAVNYLACKYVDDLHRVIPQSRYDQTLALRIRRKVIEASCYVWNWNLLFELQWENVSPRRLCPGRPGVAYCENAKSSDRKRTHSQQLLHRSSLN